MEHRYTKVITENNPEEIKKLLQEYYDALKTIQEIDEKELEHNEFWIDKSTPLGMFLAMTVDQYV